jgi:hypothetical protein
VIVPKKFRTKELLTLTMLKKDHNKKNLISLNGAVNTKKVGKAKGFQR